MMKKYFWIKILMVTALLSTASCHANGEVKRTDAIATDESVNDEIENILKDMTLEEKVAQMFIVNPELLSKSSACTGVDATMKANLQKYPVGGVIFFGKNIKTPAQTKKFIQDLKDNTKYMPFISVDEEGGRVARVAGKEGFNAQKFPGGMLAIGKTGDTNNAYQAGDVIGKYLNNLGFNLNFAPDADVFSNPANKVIGNRAFGTTAKMASPMVGACIDGLHNNGVLTCIKHFPGHGDTGTDSHTSLPKVTKTWDELIKSEIIPFKENLDKTDMVMTAHIAVTDVNEKINGKTLPSTLSHNMVTGKLRNELGYDGVVITDGFGMAGITSFYGRQGDAAVQAIKAGCDIILFPTNFLEPNGCYNVVLNAVKKGVISEERINESVRRILRLKAKLK